jgi:cytosine/adenosine deaminase-related metal-dependent hydrolase
MSYRKFSATHLFTGLEWLDNSHVLIVGTDNRIEAIVPKEAAGPDVLEFSGILSPGFINAHVHLELSAMRGLIPPGGGMTRFLMSVMQQRSLDPEMIRRSIEEAEGEMVRNGIVAAGDICNTSDTVYQKQKAKLQYHHFIELTGFIPSLAEDRYAKGQLLLDQFLSSVPGKSTLVPHAPYSVSPELFQRIAAGKNNQLISIHHQESADEEEFMLRGSGPMRSLFEHLRIDLSFFQPTGSPILPRTLSYFRPQHQLMLVHNVRLNIQDVKYIQEHRNVLPELFFCLCPNANLYIGNGLPDLDLLMQSGLPIVLGTDSLASNTQLSILDEMKVLKKHFPHIPTQQLLEWATYQGARALQLDAVYGSLEKGKSPGLVLCSEDLSRVERIL